MALLVGVGIEEVDAIFLSVSRYGFFLHSSQEIRLDR